MTTHDNPAPNDDEWVSVNGHLDYHLGFIDSGVADDIEQRFGVFPRFGRAGGCVNMVLRMETGHVVNIIDMDAPFLTALHTRGDSDGFTVAVYTEAGFENGQPLFSLANRSARPAYWTSSGRPWPHLRRHAPPRPRSHHRRQSLSISARRMRSPAWAPRPPTTPHERPTINTSTAQ
jgi:hypothetical protein